MNWIGMLVGGLAGGAAALLFAGALRLAGGDPKQPKAWHKWAYVILFALIFSVSKETITPQVQRWHLAQTLDSRLAESHPLFLAIQKYEPQAFEAMVRDARKALDDGASVEDAMLAPRKHFTALIEKKILIAPDEAALRYMRAMMQEVRELLAGGDEACYLHLFPGMGQPPNLSARLSKVATDEDLAAAAHLIESAAQQPQPVTKLEGAVLETFLRISQPLQAKYGNDLEMLTTAPTTLKGRRRVCEITLDLYEGVFALPAKEGGPVLRALLGS